MPENAKGKIVWLFGRPSSGKSTISSKAIKILENADIKVIALDGDELRQGINKDLGFSNEDREENIRRAAEIAKSYALEGFWVICALITPTNKQRKQILEIFKNFAIKMVYVRTTLNVCISRDTKGLYKRALSGEIINFTGIDSPFEKPEGVIDCEIIDTTNSTADDSVNQLMKIIAIEIKDL